MVAGRHLRRAITHALMGAAILTGISGAGDRGVQGGTPSEYQVKAAYLFYFSTYVDWFAAAPAEGGAIVVGVLGEDPFGGILDDTLQGKTVASHPLVVKRFAAARDASRCHILFVSPSEEPRLPAILKQLRGTPVLTVSDIEGFAELGGQIGFRVDDRKIRLDVNLASIQRSGLKVSAQLLKLARIVGDPDAPSGGPE